MQRLPTATGNSTMSGGLSGTAALMNPFTKMTRESKLGNNVFLKPNLIMNQLHKKSHFNAATTIFVS